MSATHAARRPAGRCHFTPGFEDNHERSSVSNVSTSTTAANLRDREVCDEGKVVAPRNVATSSGDGENAAAYEDVVQPSE